MVEKQSVINHSRYNCKSYIFVVLNDSEFTFLWEWEDVALHYRRCVIKFLCLPYFRRYFVEASSFFAFNFFFWTTSSSSSINCPSLMCSWPLIIFDGFISDFKKVSKPILKIFLPVLKFFFFLPLTLFTASYANRDCSYSTKFLILLIWSCMYSSSPFWYVFVLSWLS